MKRWSKYSNALSTCSLLNPDLDPSPPCLEIRDVCRVCIYFPSSIARSSIGLSDYQTAFFFLEISPAPQIPIGSRQFVPCHVASEPLHATIMQRCSHDIQIALHGSVSALPPFLASLISIRYNKRYWIDKRSKATSPRQHPVAWRQQGRKGVPESEM